MSRLFSLVIVIVIVGMAHAGAALAGPCGGDPAQEGLIEALEAALALDPDREPELAALEAAAEAFVEDLAGDDVITIDLSAYDNGEVGGGAAIPVDRFLAQAAAQRENKYLDCRGRDKLHQQGVQWGLTLKSNLATLLGQGAGTTDPRVRWLKRQYRNFLTGTTFPASAKAQVIDYRAGSADLLALLQRTDPRRAAALKKHLDEVAHKTRLPGGATTADLRRLEAELPKLQALAAKELIADKRPGTHTDPRLKGQLFIAPDGSLHHARYGHLLGAGQVMAGQPDRLSAYGLDPRWTKARWDADHAFFRNHTTGLWSEGVEKVIRGYRGYEHKKLTWRWEEAQANVKSRPQYLARWINRCQALQPSRLQEMNQEAADALKPLYRAMGKHYRGQAELAAAGAVAAKAVKDGALEAARKLDKTGTTQTIMAGAYELIDGIANRESPEWVAARIGIAAILEQVHLTDAKGASQKLLKTLYMATGKALQKASSEVGQHGDTHRAVDEAGAEFVNEMVKAATEQLALPEDAQFLAKQVFSQLYDHLVADHVLKASGSHKK